MRQLSDPRAVSTLCDCSKVLFAMVFTKGSGCGPVRCAVALDGGMSSDLWLSVVTGCDQGNDGCNQHISAIMGLPKVDLVG
jgi:hypothetical protein